ncbi:putative bifunctional diguanylate cyclase/phosphodiesterase [Actinoplanes friuliensis]|uniref:Putative diguanylate cyclase/phosphodiesterase with GAF sensor n=1 Tax=Actinoplanes friuliensis DSM 7358 TaxID=1246995 RepID=U5VT05_9ACTN|nr:EAL domain-containing protein [Actinoplanes friuliensis]AGZ38860.1 putative diguanylate cyclase/phosphodiesterase with GAF sensor [Actinoplanes friuliensis DSM 7358]
MGMLATQQLTEFLSAVADRPDGPAAQFAAVECAARALEAEVAVLVIDDCVVAALGVPAEQVRPEVLAEVAAGRRSTLMLAGTAYAVTGAPIGGQTPGVLVLGRTGPDFSAEDVCLLRGMARVLELSLQALTVVERERLQVEENDRLTDSLQERQRLFEHLTRIQRLIARRAPLQHILDAITAGAAELLDLELASLNLLEKDDPSVGSMVSSVGFPPDVLPRMKRVPLPSAGVAGLAVLGDELVMVEDYANSPIAIPEVVRSKMKAVMAVPVHENGEVVGCLTVGTSTGPREWDKPAQEVLRAFAEHVSLALTDARTLEAMNEAFHDSLTGLASRALFQARMERAFVTAEHENAGVAMLFVDLDRFKVVNDSLGHAAGDKLLIAVADRVRGCLRSADMAARLGGDEFAVLLPLTHGVDEAVPVARRILEAMREPFELGGKETFISCSIGVAYSVAGGHEAQELMVSADLAMYQAKKQGKDRFEIFEPALQAVFQAGLQLEADLRRAVVRHEFELRYQPIVHLRTGEITGLEALVRWQHPERGIIPPLDFIPLAEETGMIVPIGEWVLREACRQAAQWNLRRVGEKPLTVSVNLSAVQLDQADLPQRVASALEDSGLPAECLVIELTESLLVDHRPSTLHQLEQIKSLGARLAIDDFGTGYSSLAYLRRFPVDIIKIDKSFVDDVGDEPTAAALTLGIIQLGQALHLSTIAEGIEDLEQLNELTDGNCELGQGYYFAEPLTDDDMSELLFPAAGGSVGH